MYNYLSFSRFFAAVQDTVWYRNFLSVVVDQTEPGSRVLDVGTGSGKLLQMLIQEKSAVCAGVDVNQNMLDEARKKISDQCVQLYRIDNGGRYPFLKHVFDRVFICNVLFNLSKSDGIALLNEALRVLKDHGKILILSPSGNGKFRNLPRALYKPGNFSMLIWNAATQGNGLQWFKDNYVTDFCRSNQLKLKREVVFHGFALLETIER